MILIFDFLNCDAILNLINDFSFLLKSKLRAEIDEIEAKSLDIPAEHVDSAKMCVRCRDAFGYFFNKGALCPKCGFKVCSNCRVNQVDTGISSVSWLCILCHKYKFEN